MVTVTKFYCKCCDVYKISQKKLEEHYQTEKHKKKDEEAKRNESIPDYVLELRNDFSNKIQEISLENQEMKKRIQRLESISKSAIINSYNEIETVELKAFGTEDTTHLNEKKILQMMSECTSFVKDIMTQIHFNTKYPENHNIVIPNKSINIIKMYDGNKWNSYEKIDEFEKIIDSTFNNFNDLYGAKFNEINKGSFCALRWNNKVEHISDCDHKFYKEVMSEEIDKLVNGLNDATAELKNYYRNKKEKQRLIAEKKYLMHLEIYEKEEKRRNKLTNNAIKSGKGKPVFKETIDKFTTTYVNKNFDIDKFEKVYKKNQTPY
tara:strand:+ start:1594 stop:2556 length:963 start_codon:yes stop_codon:yes gene_type:complete